MKLTAPSPSFVVATVALSLAMGGVGYAAGALPHNSVGGPQLKKNAVSTKKIKDNAVTGAKILDGAVTGAKVADGAVTGAKVANGAVTGAKVADGSLTGTDLADGSVDANKVALNSLGGDQIDETTLNMPLTPGSVMLTGTDFVPRDSSFAFTSLGGGEMYAPTSPGSFAATLHVPPGATITALKLFLLDNGAQDIQSYVGLFVPTAGSNFYSSSFPTTGAANVIQTINLTPVPYTPGSVENLTVYLPAGAAYKIYGAEIDYS